MPITNVLAARSSMHLLEKILDVFIERMHPSSAVNFVALKPPDLKGGGGVTKGPPSLRMNPHCRPKQLAKRCT